MRGRTPSRAPFVVLEPSRYRTGMIEETIQEIQRAVEKAAGKGSQAEHLLAVMAIEGWREHVVWQRKVATFRLKGHSKAKRAYG